MWISPPTITHMVENYSKLGSVFRYRGAKKLQVFIKVYI